MVILTPHDVNKQTMHLGIVVSLLLCGIASALQLAPYEASLAQETEGVMSADAIKSGLTDCRRGWLRSKNKCARALQEIIHVPDGCAYQYLTRLSKVLIAQKPLLFNPATNGTVLRTFASTFGVRAVSVDAFGREYSYMSDGTLFVSLPEVKYQDTAHAVINFPGFNRDTDTEVFYYTFLLFSATGEMQYIYLVMPLAQEPIAC